MKRLCNLVLSVLLVITFSACGKQTGTEPTVDKTAEQTGQEQAATSETIQTEMQAEKDLPDRAEQQPQLQEGDNTVTGDSSFNFETKTVLLNSGYEMPIYGIGTYSLTGDTCVESVTAALNSGVRLIDTAYMYGNDVICCEL